MDATKISAVWKEWLESEEGRTATAGAIADLDDVEKAFYAGVKFGATAIADEVIAAMEKEKSLWP